MCCRRNGEVIMMRRGTAGPGAGGLPGRLIPGPNTDGDGAGEGAP